MSESQLLVNPILKAYDMKEIYVDLSRLFELLNLDNPDTGLDKQVALTKLQNEGPNVVRKPINIPEWMCCLRCLDRFSRRMNRYQAMLPSTCKIIRGGDMFSIDYSELVRGDIVFFTQGMIVPADLRILEVKSTVTVDRTNLIDETGTSQCSLYDDECDIETNDPNSVIHRPDILFMGTKILSGEGKAVVIRTGNETLWGCTCAVQRKEFLI